MKLIYSPSSTLIRSVIALVLGAVLVIWPEKVKEVLVTIVGVLLIIPSVITLMAMLLEKKKGYDKRQIMTIILGGAMAILGIIMVLFPDKFINLFTLLFGIILFLAGVLQVVGVYNYCKQTKNYYLIIVPLIILAVGVITIVNYANIPNVLLIIIWVAALLYGVSEILNYYKLKNLEIQESEKE